MKLVVIVGGGFSGALIAKKLQRDFDVILIDSKDYFEFTPGVLRCLVQREHLPEIQVLHAAYLPRARVVRGHVVRVAPEHVVLGRKKIAFDYLVVSTGSRYSMPFKEADVLIATRGKDFVAYAERLHRAERILIIGGGIEGVELAGEIVEHYSEKKIVLVHPYARLMQRMGMKCSEQAREFLQRRGVEIVLGERIVEGKQRVFLTDKQRKIEADMAFLCTGITPNSEIFSGLEVLDEKGFARVNAYLQLQGHEHIFVAGDVNNVAEEKTAQNAEAQAAVVIENIRRLERGKPLLTYQSKPRFMVISLGKKHGILARGSLVLGGRFPGWLKGVIERRVMRRYGG